MTNNSYLVELTPLGNYYFGSENTFSTTDKAETEKTSVNYLVRSRMFPQQSTLLGLLRYIILIKNNALQSDAPTREAFIGNKSFQGIEHEAPKTWGKILNISPLFITNNHKKYLVAGQDYQFYKREEQITPIQLKPKKIENASSSYTEKNGFFIHQDYDPKQHAAINWKNANDDTDILKPDDIFKESFQVGISKSFTGQTEDNAFYKQYFYRLKNGFSFATYLTMRQPFHQTKEPFLVSFGADQSLFRVTFSEEENEIFLPQQPHQGKCKITLLSDAYCHPSILEHCYLSLTSSVDFRYIKTDVNTKRFYNISNPQTDAQKSAKLNLLERGSILYTEKAQKITEELDGYIAYRNAGFNFYSIHPIQ